MKIETMTSRAELADCAKVTRGNHAGVASAIADAVVLAMNERRGTIEPGLPALRNSPYLRTWQLAQRLKRGARTPYEFVRRVEGRSPAKAGGSIGSDQGSVLGDYHDQQTPSDGDDVHVQEPVMNGIHGQAGNGLDHEQQMHAQQRHVEQCVRSLFSLGHLCSVFLFLWRYAHHNGNGHSVVHNPQHSG